MSDNMTTSAKLTPEVFKHIADYPPQALSYRTLTEHRALLLDHSQALAADVAIRDAHIDALAAENARLTAELAAAQAQLAALTAPVDAEALAKLAHEAVEALRFPNDPQYRITWDRLPSHHRAWIIGMVKEIVPHVRAQSAQQIAELTAKLEQYVKDLGERNVTIGELTAKLEAITAVGADFKKQIEQLTTKLEGLNRSFSEVCDGRDHLARDRDQWKQRAEAAERDRIDPRAIYDTFSCPCCKGAKTVSPFCPDSGKCEEEKCDFCDGDGFVAFAHLADRHSGLTAAHDRLAAELATANSKSEERWSLLEECRRERDTYSRYLEDRDAELATAKEELAAKTAELAGLRAAIEEGDGVYSSVLGGLDAIAENSPSNEILDFVKYRQLWIAWAKGGAKRIRAALSPAPTPDHSGDGNAKVEAKTQSHLERPAFVCPKCKGTEYDNWSSDTEYGRMCRNCPWSEKLGDVAEARVQAGEVKITNVYAPPEMLRAGERLMAEKAAEAKGLADRERSEIISALGALGLWDGRKGKKLSHIISEAIQIADEERDTHMKRAADLQRRLDEAEAGAAEMLSMLKVAEYQLLKFGHGFWECNCRDLAQDGRVCSRHELAARITRTIRDTNAGAALAERLRRLEAVERVARLYEESLEWCLAEFYEAIGEADDPPSVFVESGGDDIRVVGIDEALATLAAPQAGEGE